MGRSSREDRPMTFCSKLNSLTARLILLMISLIIFGAIGQTLLLSTYLRKDLAEVSSAQLLTIATYVAQDIDRDIVDRRDYLDTVAARIKPHMLTDRAALRALLGDPRDGSTFFRSGLFVIDASGLVIAGDPSLANRFGSSHGHSDYFRAAMAGAFMIGRPDRGPEAGEVVLPMATPLRDAGGKVSAVLVGLSLLRSANFLEALYTTKVGVHGGLVLVSPRDKLFIAASDGDIALTPTPPEGLHRQHDLAMNGFRGVGIDVRGDGPEELAAIASVPSAGWFLVARIPTAELFAPIHRLKGFILNSTALSLLFFTVVMAVLLRRLLSPLRYAASHADRMSRGDIPFESLPVERDDEVGHLTAAFNRVLSTLLASRAAMEHLALHDSLTGLPNRKLLNDRLGQALAQAERRGTVFALLYMDLDGFKPINDTHGHDAGDEVLRQVARRLGGVVRKGDTVARIGGDEFAILLVDLTDAGAEAALVADKCVKAMTAPIPFAGLALTVGLSIGLACYPEDGRGADELLAHGDRAMYGVKRAKAMGGEAGPAPLEPPQVQ